jgi:protocatechuate 3,4-dioxygenase beta subunit
MLRGKIERVPLVRIFVLLSASVALAQQNATEVAGTVVNSLTKVPVRKAQVTLEPSQNAESAFVATTDSAGHFRFAEVKPGRYELKVEKAGFLDGVYGGKKPDDEGLALNIASADRPQDITLLLFPGGVISGQILDADGDPMPGNEVILWCRTNSNGKTRTSRSATTSTNHLGEFRFDGLSPGAYFLGSAPHDWGNATKQVLVDSTGKPTKLHNLTTFYPNALSITDAQALHVESGQEQSGINLRIQTGLTLSVKGRIAGTTASLSDYRLTATVDEGNGWTSESGKILPTGDFEFAELPPGRHTLGLSMQGPNGRQVVGKTEVTLVDQDLTGIIITPFKPAQVRVRVVFDEQPDKPITTGTVFLNPAQDMQETFHNGHLQYQPQNGTFKIENVQPGKYQLWFNGAAHCYLKSVLSGESPVNPQLIDIAEGASLDLLMTFSKNVAAVTGDVEVSTDQSKDSVHVALIAQDEGARPSDKYRWARMDQSMHFSLDYLSPGKYLAFAAEEDDAELCRNADFVAALRSEAKEIELKEKDHPAIHLKLIPKSETDSLRKRLGI